MAQRNPQSGGFLVAYDPRNTHARRVRLVVNVSSLIMVLPGSCRVIFSRFDALVEARGLTKIEGIELRIGISSGELVVGVIGNSRQVCDVWGDAVSLCWRRVDRFRNQPGVYGPIDIGNFPLLRAICFLMKDQARREASGPSGSL